MEVAQRHKWPPASPRIRRAWLALHDQHAPFLIMGIEDILEGSWGV